MSHNQAEFKKITQKPGISVRDLAEQIQNATYKLLNLTDTQNKEVASVTNTMMMAKLLEALRPDVRLEVKKLSPQNFEEAIDFAENIDDALNEEKDHENVNNILEVEKQQAKEILTEAKINNLQDQIEKLKTQNNTTTPPVCLACGKGHYLVDCWHVKNLKFTPHMEQTVNSDWNHHSANNYYANQDLSEQTVNRDWNHQSANNYYANQDLSQNRGGRYFENSNRGNGRRNFNRRNNWQNEDRATGRQESRPYDRNFRGRVNRNLNRRGVFLKLNNNKNLKGNNKI